MKKSLIALAAAGVLASGAAAADSYTVRVEGRDGRSFATIQEHDYDRFDARDGRSFAIVQDNAYDYRRWHDEGRRMSVDERQARINARIEHGLQTGSLTRREARQLSRQLAFTEEKERAFEADGRLNGRERAELHRDLDNVAQRLRFERRDSERRY